MDEKDSLEYRINGNDKGMTQALDNVEKKGEKTLTTLEQGAQKASFSFDEIKKKALKIGALFGVSLSVLKKGMDAVLKLIQYYVNSWSKELLQASDIFRRNTESIRETAEAFDEMKEKTDGCMTKLSALAKTEKLSNVQKLEQARLLKELKANYSDLVDIMTDADGKIKNVDKAFAEKLKYDQKRQIEMIKAEMEQLKADRDIQREIIIKGTGFWRNILTRGQSVDEADKAAEKYESITKRYMELSKKLHDLNKTDKAKEYLETAEAEKKDKAENEKAEKQKKAMSDAMEGLKKLDDARQKYAEAEKKRSKALADEQIRQDKIALDSRLNSLKRRADAEKKRLGSFGFSLDVNPNESASSRRGRIRQMRMDQSIAEKQEIQREGGKVRYTAQEKRRIADYRESRGRLAKTEEQIAQLEAAGKAAEAARQQESAAARLNESATALNQAAIELRGAGGTVPAQPSAQPSTAKTEGVRNTKAAAQPVRRVNIATGISQTVSYGPILTHIANLLQTRAFIIRNN